MSKGWLDIIELIKWPITVIIIFFLIRKHIIEWIRKATKLKISDAEFEAGQQNVQLKQQEQAEHFKAKNIDNALKLFRPGTVTFFDEQVALETDIDKVTVEHDKIELLRKYATALYLKMTFEKTYHLLFGSQLKLLEELNSIREGANDDLFEHFYNQAKALFPGNYANYPLQDYRQFMINAKLITFKSEKYFITNLGVDFLKYITEQGIDKNKNL